MKWLRSNGRTLEVRGVGPVMYVVSADDRPLPILDEVLSDDRARDKLTRLLAQGYEGRRIK
jgi:hypothetical protein